MSESGVDLSVPSEPAEDVNVMCQRNDYPQRRNLAVRQQRCGLKQ